MGFEYKVWNGHLFVIVKLTVSKLVPQPEPTPFEEVLAPQESLLSGLINLFYKLQQSGAAP